MINSKDAADTVAEEVVKDVAKVAKPKRAPRVTKEAPEIKMAEDFDVETYFAVVDDQEETPEGTLRLVKRQIIHPKYNKHLVKCRLRTAQRFNVKLSHMDDAYISLNGKRIDGYLANELIDRFGFSNGVMENRGDIAERHGTHISSVDVATTKLIGIVKHADVLGAYKKYLESFLVENRRRITDDALNI